MKFAQITLCIAETIRDCEQAVLWAVENQKKYSILAISLETKEFCSQKNIPHTYIWNEVDMDSLLHKAYDESVKQARAWVKHFSGSKFADLDKSIEHSLSHGILQHSIACSLLAQEISKHIARDYGSIWLSKPKVSFLSIYAPYHQKSQSNTILCEMIFDLLYGRSRIEHWNLAYRRYLTVRQKITPWWKLLVVFSFGIMEIPLARTLKKIQAVHNQVDNRNVGVIFSGWGRDLHRMINLENIEKEISRSSISAFHTIWRPGKLSIPRSVKNNSIRVKEQLGRGTSLGPRASMFTLIKYIKLHLRLVASILPSRLFHAHKFKYSAVTSQVKYHLVFAYRDALLSYYLTLGVLNKIHSQIYVGCDSGSVGARAELLAAKSKEIKTVGTPHGFLHHWLHSNFEIADYGAVYSQDAKRLIEFGKAKSSKNVWTIGHTYTGYKKKRANTTPRNITLATRSWGGYWSNIASHHKKYDEALQSLLKYVAKETKHTIRIKSHPNGDLHTYYDLLAKKYGKRVKHVPQGWTPEKFTDSTDVLVCMGDIPSLFVYALHSNIPIVFQTSTFSSAQKTLDYKHMDAGIVSSTSSETIQNLEQLLESRAKRAACVKNQSQSVTHQHKDTPEKILIDRLHGLIT